MRSACLHCKTVRFVRHRGLCERCYNSADIRCKYPRLDKKSELDTLTESELDALIAERMKVLPDWWESESDRAKPKRWTVPMYRPRYRRNGESI